AGVLGRLHGHRRPLFGHRVGHDEYGGQHRRRAVAADHRLHPDVESGQLGADVLRLVGDLPDGRRPLAVHRRAHTAGAACPLNRSCEGGAKESQDLLVYFFMVLRPFGLPSNPSIERDMTAHRNVLDTFRLDGKVALITGGARGLGRTMAIALGEAGADLALVGRSRESCKEAAAEIAGATGGTVRGVAAGVTSTSDVTRVTGEIMQACGSIDILVNNAGTNIRGTIERLSEADWDNV